MRKGFFIGSVLFAMHASAQVMPVTEVTALPVEQLFNSRTILFITVTMPMIKEDLNWSFANWTGITKDGQN
jgi:N6-adenosine-specific RNA methylase IME4